MNKKIKYILCIAVSAAITSLIVFLPYFSYSADDLNNRNDFVTETFLLKETKENISVDEVIKLLTSDESEAIWINNNDDMEYDEVWSSIQGAITAFEKSFSKNQYVQYAIKIFMENAALMYPMNLQTVTVNGQVSDFQASVSLLYAEYINDSGTQWYSILMDRKTKIIYELQVHTNFMIYDNADLSERVDDAVVEKEIYNQTFNELRNYWNTGTNKLNTLSTGQYQFLINILPMSFESYKFNSFDFSAMGYDEQKEGDVMIYD